MNIAFLGGIGMAEIAIFLIPMMVLAAVWVWAIVDIVRASSLDNSQKIIWLLVVIFVPAGLGALIYFALGRKTKATA